MIARVNGEERSRGNLRAMYHPWDALVAQAARNTMLRPGDVIGSGTVGNGCILEHGDGRWLQRGDVVELEIEGIGVLQKHGRVIAADDVRAAARVLDGVAHRTPVIASRTLGEHVVAQAREPAARGCVQVPRRVQQDLVAPDGNAVVAFSSGNHAQAVALAAQLLGAHATILMPDDAPPSEARGDAWLRRRDRHLRPLHGRPRSDRWRARGASAARSSCRRTTTR